MLNLKNLIRRRNTATTLSGDRTIYWLLNTVGLVLIVPAWLLPWFIEQTIIGVTKKSGYGFSPQDALSQLFSFAPTGIGSFLVLGLFLVMLALIAGFLWDVFAVSLKGRPLGPHRRERLIALGAAVAWMVIGGLIGAGLSITTVAAGALALVMLVTFARDGLTHLFRNATPFHFMRARGGLALLGVLLTLGIWALVGVSREEDLFGHLGPNAVTDNAVWMMLAGMAVVAFAFLGTERIALLIASVTVAGVALVGVGVPWMRTDAFLSKRVYADLTSALSRFEGLTTPLLYVVLIAVGVTVLGAGADVVASIRARAVVIVAPRVRGAVALLGAAAATGAIWLVVTSRNNAFGVGISTIDDRVGVIIGGLCAAGLLMLLGDRLVNNRAIGLGVVALALAGLFPLIFNQSPGFIGWGAQTAAVYTLLALGLNVVVGFAGLLDLGYAAFFAIGAYTAASLNSPKHGVYWSFWIIIPVAAGMAALFGVLLGAPTLRLRGDYLAIVTLGFGEIIPDMAKNNLFNQTGGPNGITGIHKPDIFGYNFGLDPRPFFWALLIVIGLVMLGLHNLERSRVGRAWVAVREDEVAASATGINTVTTKLLAFAIGASISGIGGAFFGAQLGLVTNEDFVFAVSVTALSTVVLGGIGSNIGAAVGGISISFIIFWVLGHLQEWMTTFGENTGVTALNTVSFDDYKYIVYGVILISVMLLRPGGLLPSRARKVELTAHDDQTPLAAVMEVA